MNKITAFIISWFIFSGINAQVSWVNADTDFGELPLGFHVFKSTDSLDGKPFKAFYAIADLGSKKLDFTTDTTLNRRLKPSEYFEKNNHPLLVVNSTFFSFTTNQSLNLVIKDGRMLAYNIHSLPGKGKDTLTFRHAFNGAIGISKDRKADIAWIYSDSLQRFPLASQQAVHFFKDSIPYISKGNAKSLKIIDGKRQTQYGEDPTQTKKAFAKTWKMQTAVAGGPVLVQHGEVQISNNEELKFNGKAINDKHPRILMGYTNDDKLIIMAVEGRNPGVADGVTLTQAAQLLKELGCREALNLDGGGSSCMLINGKETIRPSDKGNQRPVPAVFIIQRK
jgi:exopolysaccharide biosynthesis protein